MSLHYVKIFRAYYWKNSIDLFVYGIFVLNRTPFIRSMLKVILVDDDVNDLRTMSEKLALCGSDISIVAKCFTVAEAVKAIHTIKPDIVFSDIEMPGLSGLQLPDFFDENDLGFELIYATSYSEFAVRAFQLSAIDYLIKPIDKTLLLKAVNKVRKKQNYQAKERAALLKENLQKQEAKRIALPYNGGVNFIDTADVVYLKADNVYTDIFLLNGSSLTVSKPLKELDNVLPKPQFFRCHRSYLVNLHMIKGYITTAGGEIVVKSGINIPLARDRKEEFISLWQKGGL
ncbi:MAG: LytTR family DNA-binding domain-containing protein [Chitinophagales bacterium]